ncbi:hypothetical protein BSR28_02065 [Boudabousia liubingyangii]|uniref:hydroxymethylpyrimidine/phosphomethylpyrimidine kinase n=1 Tax=Boudabousia liubingyangii TaxID=1921764 RepID=UPI00093F6892|nr:bifunctional hydroxymethylpyrimidine kinase/phosphomethylpyrimidine kinase [Boudabousia liubingyangii]OKL48500.1 hypothetical protein BSR28_02065 [Boudabousia liubingyangii]
MSPTSMIIAGLTASGAGGLSVDFAAHTARQVRAFPILTCSIALPPKGEVQKLVVPAQHLSAQMWASFAAAGQLDAIQTGLLGSAENLHATADFLRAQSEQTGGTKNIVIDPVLFFKSGSAPKENEKTIRDLKTELLPLGRIITPNLSEAQLLAGREVTGQADLNELKELARQLGEETGRGVLVKGGMRLSGPEAADVYYEGGDLHVLSDPKIGDQPVNGTGCTLASLITVGLAKGQEPLAAVEQARAQVRAALACPRPTGLEFDTISLLP